MNLLAAIRASQIQLQSAYEAAGGVGEFNLGSALDQTLICVGLAKTRKVESEEVFICFMSLTKMANFLQWVFLVDPFRKVQKQQIVDKAFSDVWSDPRTPDKSPQTEAHFRNSAKYLVEEALPVAISHGGLEKFPGGIYRLTPKGRRAASLWNEIARKELEEVKGKS